MGVRIPVVNIGIMGVRISSGSKSRESGSKASRSKYGEACPGVNIGSVGVKIPGIHIGSVSRACV